MRVLDTVGYLSLQVALDAAEHLSPILNTSNESNGGVLDEVDIVGHGLGMGCGVGPRHLKTGCILCRHTMELSFIPKDFKISEDVLVVGGGGHSNPLKQMGLRNRMS